MFLHTGRRFQTALAAGLRYGNYRWFELALPQQFGCKCGSPFCFICCVKDGIRKKQGIEAHVEVNGGAGCS